MSIKDDDLFYFLFWYPVLPKKIWILIPREQLDNIKDLVAIWDIIIKYQENNKKKKPTHQKVQ